MKKILLIIFLVLFVSLACVVVFTSIETVEVSGNEWYTTEEIENLIFKDKLSRNTAYQLIRGFLGKKENIPFVEDYKIYFKSYDSVEVFVYEKSITGYVSYMSSYMYFDKDGIIVDSSPERLESIPEITGLKFGSIVLYRKLPVDNEKIFGNIMNLSQTLTLYSIKTDEIHYDQSGNATLYIGGLSVVLGDTANISGKLAELADMLPSVQEKMRSESIDEGILYLDTYEEDNSNPMYTFKRK